ncbi:phosphodiesterase [Mycobacterium sp. 1274756.6]|uniref:phosphodiesterase n=1 Tax=Mycobacterium sp. 1274756.6 TaxID=1834076 RepID=UPI0007FD596B|nr:phosphodiesterase [Mycobacterium sp. 1274756.6]OBJ68847.1 phosphodiesterase [Mycobacterium sp. 1274756.6]
MDSSELVAAPFRWGAALRNRRLFHPTGVLATGDLDRIAPPEQGLPVPSSAIVARISKGLGTPGALPDAVGLAFRVTMARQQPGPWDVLMVTAGSGPLSRVIGVHPVLSWSGLTLSTLMPLRYHGRPWWLRARMHTGLTGPGLSLTAVGDQLDRAEIRVELDQAAGGGDFRPLAELTLRKRLVPVRDDDVAFDPVRNTAPGVELSPHWLAGLRASAYRGSRTGRAAG